MRYSTNHKAGMRQRILNAASASMRRGSGRTNIKKIMQGAGLTHGGFYTYFSSREALLRECFVEAVDRLISKWRLAQRAGDGRTIVANYLSVAHRDNPGAACAISGFVEEIGFGAPETKRVFAAKTNEIVEAMPISNGDACGGRSDRIAALCLMVGALMIARACGKTALSEEVLHAAREAATRICDHPRSEPT